MAHYKVELGEKDNISYWFITYKGDKTKPFAMFELTELGLEAATFALKFLNA